jgi:hypothetical protein
VECLHERRNNKITKLKTSKTGDDTLFDEMFPPEQATRTVCFLTNKRAFFWKDALFIWNKIIIAFTVEIYGYPVS